MRRTPTATGLARTGRARSGTARATGSAPPGAAGVVVLGFALAACSAGGGSATSATPTPADPACAPVVAALPSTVLGQERTATRHGGEPVDAQWGSPPITFACGHLPEEPTTDPCITVDGVDWVFRDGGELSFVSYGTDPAVEVLVPEAYGRENATGALVDLADAARLLPTNGRACVG